MRILAFLLFLGAFLVPFCSAGDVEPRARSFGAWPSAIEGQELTELPLGERETRFASEFPGKLGRFTDGRREYILRWVSRPTRTLHPAQDCFRGSGYATSALPVKRTERGEWGCFAARRDGAILKVCERIEDGAGHSFSDTSAWFWAAITGRSTGPWLAVTVAERES